MKRKQNKYENKDNICTYEQSKENARKQLQKQTTYKKQH